MTAKQSKKLKKAIDAYNSIDSAKDLDRQELTLAEYNAIPRNIERLSIQGYSETFMYGVTEWFRRQGFKIVFGTVNYRILLD